MRTLVVDDDFRVADLHRRYVERVDGFEACGTALTGRQALEQVEALHPDLVLLDVYLPDLSGLEVARAIRQRTGRQPDLLFVTAARNVDTVREAMRGGALHYLVKPFSFATFRDKLVGCREWAARLQATTEADQEAVDSLYGLLRPASSHADLPKGLARPTLALIARVVEEFDGDASAAEVAARSGVSRGTARRYLEHLCHVGRVELRPRYGTSGRPEHRFRSLVAPTDVGGPAPG